MNTFLDIIHLIVSIFGALFLIYLFRLIWRANKWRFSPKKHKQRIKQRQAESQLAAIKRKEKAFSYHGKKIWAKTFREAVIKYQKLSKKDQKRLTEIF